jgi:hypothetical protein
MSKRRYAHRWWPFPRFATHSIETAQTRLCESLTPRSGRRVSHDLRDSFGKALQEHRDELLSDMPTLPDDLVNL